MDKNLSLNQLELEVMLRVLNGEELKFENGHCHFVKNGELNEFFNSLSVDELDALWSKPEIRDVIEACLRSPGGLHEWHLVSRTPQFK